MIGTAILKKKSKKKKKRKGKGRYKKQQTKN
jgi:hypothetical protein